ncbi:hypothetical protein DCS_05774 [Drechmeria coniospora]|uniref:Cell wall protein n=1 Tax=Drechmeria coniospora TaxID=98403 RepID=A0A151GNT7_DRECN|nr:hypothetical protein DCS_05774 [Drechmeria coniospora]KYK58756.1 hypothetical protein DCS_05774 [Drechmeria coniospora]
MQFLAVACLAAGALAGTIDTPSRVFERDLATVTGVIANVGTKIEALDTAAKAFSGDQAGVLGAAKELISTLEAGTKTVSGSAELTLSDAVALQGPVTALQSKAEKLESNFLAKRSAVEEAGACDAVRKALSDISTNSEALIKAVVGKVPTDAQAIAKTLAEGLTTVLAKAKGDFSADNCKAKAASSSSPATKSATASAKSSSSSAAASSASSSVSSASSSASATSSASSTTVRPSGSGGRSVPQPTGTNSTGVTAGAGAFIAPAGLFVVAVAAMIV